MRPSVRLLSSPLSRPVGHQLGERRTCAASRVSRPVASRRVASRRAVPCRAVPLAFPSDRSHVTRRTVSGSSGPCQRGGRITSADRGRGRRATCSFHARFRFFSLFFFFQRIRRGSLDREPAARLRTRSDPTLRVQFLTIRYQIPNCHHTFVRRIKSSNYIHFYYIHLLYTFLYYSLFLYDFLHDSWSLLYETIFCKI